jgi:hypothetical protein
LRGSKLKAKTRVFTASAAGAWVAWLDASMLSGCANNMSHTLSVKLRSSADACSVPTQAH